MTESLQQLNKLTWVFRRARSVSPESECLLQGERQESIRMNSVRAIVGVLVLWSGTAWGAALTWNANTEPDLAGYRIYQCSQQPCTRASANESLLTTLGKVTSFNIGTPSARQYYFTTAFDLAGNESSESNLATFTPTGAPPPPVQPPPMTPPPPMTVPPAPGGLHISAVQ